MPRAFDALKPDLRAALELAAQRIRAYHEAQSPRTAINRRRRRAPRREVARRSMPLGSMFRAAARPIPPRC
jgi:histidinol dehydrogenase